ncbi:hypothetical protein [Hydrogenovibrio sp.]|uniref:hypothetical protein n=1 Tax=Hydrogenovibrio sp. TaxID=2065821 RepID=UPI002870259F|nr:hypothetical protein [Hydrogenovibrio sp.]
MKHTFAKLTPVALACGLAMNPVMAEDVMKVYGQVNVSYDNTSMNDAAEAYEVAKGNWVGRTVGSEIKSNASRLGMLGSLDTTLDQTKLIYKAEFQYGVAGNNGLTGDQSDQLFVREAFAGLKNN